MPVLRVDVRHRPQGDLEGADAGRIAPASSGWTRSSPPDGRGYVYTYHRLLTDLYLVEGLK